MQCQNLHDLFLLLRHDGDQILDARSRLTLSTSLLHQVNEALHQIVPSNTDQEDHNHNILFNFMEKTLALKLFNDIDYHEHGLIDIHIFSNLKLLELHRLSVHFLRGLKTLRAQLEYVTCNRSAAALKDVLELCGGDQSQGYVWSSLKEAAFTHNHWRALDNSLEFVPALESLDLSYNKLHCIEYVNYLRNLQHLNLSNNDLSVLPNFTCDGLKTLILRHNYIERVDGLRCLTQLEYLDVSWNCVLETGELHALNKLKRLSFAGNPISYHPNYRTLVCACLSSGLQRDFQLDGKPLNGLEVRALSSAPVQNQSDVSSQSDTVSDDTIVILLTSEQREGLPSFGSFQSCATGNTVIERREQTSDMEVSASSSDMGRPTRIFDLNLGLGMQMHDSGIVTGTLRPASPIDSIGSAESLHQEVMNLKRFSESDIEILSNPSQSSIEVLHEYSTPKCVLSTIICASNLSGMCPDEDLKKVGEELHRSL